VAEHGIILKSYYLTITNCHRCCTRPNRHCHLVTLRSRDRSNETTAERLEWWWWCVPSSDRPAGMHVSLRGLSTPSYSFSPSNATHLVMQHASRRSRVRYLRYITHQQIRLVSGRSRVLPTI